MQSLHEVNAAAFEADREFAEQLDSIDPLSGFRSKFHVPKLSGKDSIYLCGNSLGLQPVAVRDMINQELDDWCTLGVKGHREASNPWFSYHELFQESGARLVGAIPGEVVMMNSLTVNLHMMLRTFFRPEGARTRILIEEPAFPSDTYAVKSHLRTRGLDPDEHLVTFSPRQGEDILRTEDLEQLLQEQGDMIALILLGGVNFYTGQVLDMQAITKIGHEHGCIVGFDLAHAAGNIPLRLHDWNVDFAAWCSYKYLNSGPGAVAGCFIHADHGADTSLQRYGGWWGNDPEQRFMMHLQPEFKPVGSADGWQVSNPPILSMTPLLASLKLFDEAGMDRLREKSRVLTGYLEYLLRELMGEDCRIITPADPGSRGCQLSIRVLDEPERRFESLERHGVICDFRKPDVIRVAPTPLYNTFMDAWNFARILTEGG
ncbi:MAG: kynureninase [Phycisphaerae bacterium]|nr:kynureninase [Phycisphaerae bacterium]